MRMYELVIEVFTAWEKLASMILRVNAYGMGRAQDKVLSTLKPLKESFETLVRSSGASSGSSS